MVESGHTRTGCPESRREAVNDSNSFLQWTESIYSVYKDCGVQGAQLCVPRRPLMIYQGKRRYGSAGRAITRRVETGTEPRSSVLGSASILGYLEEKGRRGPKQLFDEEKLFHGRTRPSGRCATRSI